MPSEDDEDIDHLIDEELVDYATNHGNGSDRQEHESGMYRQQGPIQVRGFGSMWHFML